MKSNKNISNLKPELKKIFSNLKKLDPPSFLSLPNDDFDEHFLNYSIALKNLEESRYRYIKKIESEILCDKFYQLIYKEFLSRGVKKFVYKKKTIKKIIVDSVVDIITASDYEVKKDFYPKGTKESIVDYETRIIKKIKKNNLKAILINHEIKCYLEIIGNRIVPTFVPLNFFPMDTYTYTVAKKRYVSHKSSHLLKAISEVICTIGRRLTYEYYLENEIDLECVEDLERLKKKRNYANIDINKSIALCAGFIKGFSKFSKLEIESDRNNRSPINRTEVIKSKFSELRVTDRGISPLEEIGSPLFVNFSYTYFIDQIHHELHKDDMYMWNLRGCSNIAVSPFIIPERYDQYNEATMSFKQSILDGLDASRVELKKKNKLKDFNDLMEAELDNFYNAEILDDLKKGKSLSEVNNLSEKEAYLYCKSRLDVYPKLEIERIRKKITKYYIKNEKGSAKNDTSNKRRYFSKKFEIYINKNLTKEISLYAKTNALINENHFLYESEPYNHYTLEKLEKTILKYEHEIRLQNKNQELIENCINEFRFWISQERQLPTYSSTQRSSLSYDKSFSNIYGKFMPNDFFKLDSVYNQKGKYSNDHINKAKKHIEQFINFIHLNPESTKTFERMFHVARRHYLEEQIKNKNLDMSNVTEDDLLLGEEARFWELLLIFVHTKSSILSRTFMQDICGTLIRAILFIEGIYAYGEKIEEDLSSNLYSMVVAELDFILPVFDAHIEAMTNQIYWSDKYTLNIPIGYKFFSWQFREAVLDLRNFISAMEDINIYDLPKPSYHKSKNPSFEQVLLLSKNKREVYLKNIHDLRKYIDKRKCKNKNKSEKKDYQRYAQIRNAGLKADDQGKINRKEAKKWLKSRSGRRKLNELYIDNNLDYLIGYIDFEEMCS